MNTVRHVATGGILALAVGISFGLAAFFSTPVTVVGAVIFAVGGAAGTALVYGAGALMGERSAEVDNRNLAAEVSEAASLRVLGTELDSEKVKQLITGLQSLETRVNGLEIDLANHRELTRTQQDHTDTVQLAVNTGMNPAVPGPSGVGLFSKTSQSVANDPESVQKDRTRGVRTRTG